MAYIIREKVNQILGTSGGMNVKAFSVKDDIVALGGDSSKLTGYMNMEFVEEADVAAKYNPVYYYDPIFLINMDNPLNTNSHLYEEKTGIFIPPSSYAGDVVDGVQFVNKFGRRTLQFTVDNSYQYYSIAMSNFPKVIKALQSSVCTVIVEFIMGSHSVSGDSWSDRWGIFDIWDVMKLLSWFSGDGIGTYVNATKPGMNVQFIGYPGTMDLDSGFGMLARAVDLPNLVTYNSHSITWATSTPTTKSTYKPGMFQSFTPQSIEGGADWANYKGDGSLVIGKSQEFSYMMARNVGSYLSRIAIWDKCLTPDQLKAIYNNRGIVI